jgi:hypothetical protein
MMKRSIFSIIIGVVLSPLVFVVLFIVDMTLQLTPASKVPRGEIKPENAMVLFEQFFDILLFVYIPVTTLFVGIIVSLIAKARRWLCSGLAVLPFVICLYIEMITKSPMLLIIKSTYLAFSYLVMAGLIGVIIQRMFKRQI